MSIFNSPSKSALLLLGTLGILIISTLIAISSYFLQPAIELDLKRKLIINFFKAGIDTSIIHISGRDITLNGSVSSKNNANIAEDLAKKISGVRQVKNNLSISNDITE